MKGLVEVVMDLTHEGVLYGWRFRTVKQTNVITRTHP